MKTSASEPLEDTISVVHLTTKSVPRIDSAERQFRELVRDLQDEQGLDSRSICVALGMLLAELDEFHQVRVLAGWTIRGLEENPRSALPREP